MSDFTPTWMDEPHPFDRSITWLDEHPDQSPGGTMTQSDYQKIIDETSVPYGVGFTDGFHQAGGSITPDPEPTSKREARKEVIMAGKYESLYEPMINDETFDLTTAERLGALVAMQWLDQHTNQVPGRTITASRKREIAQRLEFDPRYSFDEMVHDFGLVSVPDPEPTNAEKLDKDIQEVDLHLTSRQLAEALIERGWTKAPEEQSNE